MRRIAVVLLFGLVTISAAFAGRAGYSRVFNLPGSGELTIRNTQKNSSWRPTVVAVMCPSSASRTVMVYRVVGELEYALSSQAATAQTYVYEFEAEYWCDLSNGVRVAVTPACTGIVEVIYE
jgi:hypothetical protein